MFFDVDRARIVTGIRESTDDAAFWHFRDHKGGSIWVPKEQLRVEHHPELENESGCVLLDIAGTEAILAAEERKKLLAFFQEASIMFPGFRRTRRARVIN